jgi:hypothetical protein
VLRNFFQRIDVLAYEKAKSGKASASGASLAATARAAGLESREVREGNGVEGEFDPKH